MGLYETISGLCKDRGVPISQLEKTLGFANGSIGKLRTQRSMNVDRLKKIAEYFNVPVEYLLTGKHPEQPSIEGKAYYFSDETAEAAQELFDNKDLRALMSAARDVDPEAIRAAAKLLEAWKETNPDE